MSSTLTFKVVRKTPKLIPPIEPTPYDFKYLSDLDNKIIFQLLISGIHFYRKNPSMEGKDPVNIIRDAIAKALVFYYPFAGRLRKYGAQKLAVECCGEGVVFIEADANVMLQQFGDTLYPPFPNLEELLPVVPDSFGIIDSPLWIFQVTRLRCGGFILGFRFNHAMCDGTGAFQFLSAVGELARGAAVPSIHPIWERHLLSAETPATNVHDDVVPNFRNAIPLDNKVERAFIFSATDISALRRSLPPHHQSCSKFEVVAACAWRCWTIAISPKPNDEIRFLCAVDMRKRMRPQLPAGYYGNAVVGPAAVTTVEKLRRYPLQYAVELVRKAKSEATDEYVRNQIGTREEGIFTGTRTYLVSDLTHGGFRQVDFGWGPAAYGGVANGVVDLGLVLSNWYMPFKDDKGEDGIIVPVCLPINAMEIFVEQLQMMLNAAAFKISAL